MAKTMNALALIFLFASVVHSYVYVSVSPGNTVLSNRKGVALTNSFSTLTLDENSTTAQLTGSLTVTADTMVSGFSTFSKLLTASSGIKVTGTSSVSGTSTFSSKVTVESGGVAVTAGGIQIAAGGLTVSAGAVSAAAGVTVTSGGVAIQGGAAGTLQVSGLTTLSGQTAANGGLTVGNGASITGGATVNGGVIVQSGTVQAQAGLIVSGSATQLQSAVTASNGVTVSNGGLAVQAGGISVSGGNLQVTNSGTLSISGTSTLTGLVQAPGGATVGGTFTAGTASLGGVTTLSSAGTGLVVNTASSFSQQATHSALISVTAGGITVSGGNLALTGASAFSVNAASTLTGLLTANGGATIGGTLTAGTTQINGVLNAAQTLSVTGTTTLAAVNANGLVTANTLTVSSGTLTAQASQFNGLATFAVDAEFVNANAHISIGKSRRTDGYFGQVGLELNRPLLLGGSWSAQLTNAVAAFATSGTSVMQTSTGDMVTMFSWCDGGEATELRLYVLDDPEDQFAIYGNSCGGGACNNINLAIKSHYFTGGGNAFHAGNLEIGGIARHGCPAGWKVMTNNQGCISPARGKNFFWDAETDCMSVSGHVCSHREMWRGCSSGFAMTVTPVWFADKCGDDCAYLSNGLCTSGVKNFDGGTGNTNNDLNWYHCCIY